MKEIKVRIWSKLRKMYIADSMSLLDIADYSGSLEWPLIMREKGNVIQGYTGSKDKNGKEIYEGDICSFEGNAFFKSNNCEIKWDAQKMGWFTEAKDHAFYWHLDRGFCSERLSVIGNTFENPELLEKEGDEHDN